MLTRMKLGPAAMKSSHEAIFKGKAILKRQEPHYQSQNMVPGTTYRGLQ